ncbi:hypothetical protein MC885_007828 [Smutsia gigantea]|nr:hypothetical protein MC885_007828 [Smutsia gigantea]
MSEVNVHKVIILSDIITGTRYEWRTPAIVETVRPSEQTLRTALISKNPALVSRYEKLNAGEQRLMNKAFQPNSDPFGPITLHSKSDWIISQPEAPQDFEQFFSDPYRKAPSPEKRNIGALGNTRIISEEYIKWLKGYCEAFFYSLTVKLLEPVAVSATKCSFRVNDSTQNLLIHAGHMLKFLKKKKLADSFCIVGITMIDLYPRGSWNFVFGQASLTDGVGMNIQLCQLWNFNDISIQCEFENHDTINLMKVQHAVGPDDLHELEDSCEEDGKMGLEKGFE